MHGLLRMRASLPKSQKNRERGGRAQRKALAEGSKKERGGEDQCCHCYELMFLTRWIMAVKASGNGPGTRREEEEEEAGKAPSPVLLFFLPSFFWFLPFFFHFSEQ